MNRRAVTYGLAPIVALAATVAVEAGERQSLAQAVEGIQDEFGISDFAIGLLPAAMTVIGVLGSIPIGILADRVRRTRLLGIAVAVWTAAMGVSAVAPSYGSLFSARLAVGAVEGNGPAAISLIGDYYPVRNRARMFGLYQAGALVGSLIGLVGGGLAVAAGGWRWAFWIWVPLGLAVAIWVWRLHEPARGEQDSDLSLEAAELHDAALDPVPVLGSVDAVSVLELPPPARVGTLDYDRAGPSAVLRELLRIRSMWLALVALTVSQFLLVGLQFWGVEFFKRAHGLGAAGAAGFTGLFGLGAAAGVLTGGTLSDRYLERGVVNARIYVVAIASIAAPIALVPAFLIDNIWLTAPFFLIGGMLLTVPVAPGEAVVSDVVAAPLRGRAAAVRGIVRSLAALSPVVIGVLSDGIGLRSALAVVTPIYAVGGVMMLLATRTYPSDLAFVAAEADRLRTEGAGVASDPHHVPSLPTGPPD